MSQRIRIQIKTNEHQGVDKSAQLIIKALSPTGTKVIGPIPMPTKKEKFTVIRSPHVNKKSREQFELKTHKRLIDIEMPTTAKSHEVLDTLMNIELQAGAEVDIIDIKD